MGSIRWMYAAVFARWNGVGELTPSALRTANESGVERRRRKLRAGCGERLVRIGRKRSHVDERLDLCIAGCRARNHCAAIRMSDENDGAFLAFERTSYGCDVVRQRRERNLHGGDGIAVVFE